MGVNRGNGRSTIWKYRKIYVEKNNSSRLPLLTFYLISNIPQQPSRNHGEDHIERIDAGHGVEVTINNEFIGEFVTTTIAKV